MRPVNLIPPEDRRGEQAPLRTGPLSYIVLGALVAVLLGVVVLVLTGNQISEREDEVATLKSEDAAAATRAAQLASYTQFRELSEQRVQTVQSLADSRFDWERVLRELALILPSDVSLTELSASSGGSAAEAVGGAESASGLTSGVAGPALSLGGCAHGQKGVAEFVTALKDIDGVTRVGVQSSTVAGKNGESSGGSEGSECGVLPGAATFSIAVAFDAAPVPAAEGEIEVAPEAAPEAAQAASSETSESSSESSGESSEGE
jgi:Tfp pilus assembly protein PilN